MGCKSSKHAEHAEHEPNGATPSVLHGGFRFEKGAEHGFRTIAVPVDPAQGLGMAIVTLIDPAGLRIDGVVRRSCPRHPAPRCSYIRCPPAPSRCCSHSARTRGHRLNLLWLAGCRCPPPVRYAHLQRVSKVSAGGSADRSGIAVGDVIVDINGRSVLHATHDVVIGMLRAARRTVTITMLPPQVRGWP